MTSAAQPDNSNTKKRSFRLHPDAVEIFAFYALAPIAAIMFIGAQLLWLAAPVSPHELLTTSGFDGGLMAKIGIGLAIGVPIAVVLGWAVGVAKGTPMPGVWSMVLSLLLSPFFHPNVALSLKVAQGTAHIGCFDYSAKECRSMLHADAAGVTSDAQSAQRNVTGIEKLPGSWVLYVPYYMLHTGKLNAKLDAQRAVLKSFMASHSHQ